MEALDSWQLLDYLSERAYRLVRVDPASEAALETYFHDDVILRGWINAILFDVSPKFLEIISSSCAPTIDDFREICKEYGYSKDYWTIYILIMEK